jgi:hypothetical protein
LATREDEMSAYDSLPRDLRRALDENATNLSAVNCVVQAWKLLDMGASPARAAQAVANKIRQIEPNEIAIFGGEYKSKYNSDLGHIAARATVMRYGPAGPSRHPPRRAPRIRGFRLDVQVAA